MSEEAVTSEMYDADGRRLYIAPDTPGPFPELTALEREASPRPWEIRHGPYHAWPNDGSWSPALYACHEVDQGNGDPIPGNEEQREANIRLAAIMVNIGPEALRALAEVQQAWLHDNTCSACLADEECTERVAISGNLTARVNGVLGRARELLRDG